MIITRPQANETDLLAGNEFKKLVVKTLNYSIIKTIEPPVGGWTHLKLEVINYSALSEFGWNAYLDDIWIGGSEI